MKKIWRYVILSSGSRLHLVSRAKREIRWSGVEIDETLCGQTLRISTKCIESELEPDTQLMLCKVCQTVVKSRDDGYIER